DFGLIIPEALSLGTPVIYFNKGGAKEILSSGYGQAFENQTADSLSRAILKFETNKFDSTKLIELGNQFSVSNFTNQITKLIETKM
ncbi:MAG: glycosyltransferase, partial [Proteobacteria bacterium]|nr:glycosyltransferase [Pseudomonadota bacterium]